MMYQPSERNFNLSVLNLKSTFSQPHQWLSSFELKTGRQEVPVSIQGQAYWPCRAEFSVVFSETHINMG